MASIRKRPDGKWRARYRDPSGKELARHFERRMDAERFITSIEHAKIVGSYVDPGGGKLKVGEWADRWMEGRVHLKPKTMASYESLLKTQVLPRWAPLPLAAVRHAEVVAWVAAMSGAGLSASRTRQAYHLFKSMLDDAVADNRLARNPAVNVDLPRLRTVEPRYLTHEQLAVLAEACGEYETLVSMLGYTGLRWSEAVGLRVRRVDLLRRRVDVTEAGVEVNGRMIFGTPKAHQARSVPVPRFLTDDLASHLAGKAPGDLVFTSPSGGVLRSGNWRRRVFDPAVARTGLDGVTPHSLRHSAASLAIAAGASVKAVQAMLGHASATLTLDRYGHLFPDELDAVAERLTNARADSVRTNRGLGQVRQLPA